MFCTFRQAPHTDHCPHTLASIHLHAPQIQKLVDQKTSSLRYSSGLSPSFVKAFKPVVTSIRDLLTSSMVTVRGSSPVGSVSLVLRKVLRASKQVWACSICPCHALPHALAITGGEITLYFEIIVGFCSLEALSGGGSPSLKC